MTRNLASKKAPGVEMQLILLLRKAVDNLTQSGSTANMCSINLRKAFDKVNHCGLYIKLMKRFVPTALLEVIENWLSGCYAFVKWYDSSSFVFSICFGVRQGSVSSPHLFAVYIDDVGKIFYLNKNSFILLYADDMLLITSSVTVLHCKNSYLSVKQN